MSKKGQSQGRVRVFFAEFEGEDETIQEGIRALVGAVKQTFQPRTVVKHLPSPNGNNGAEDQLLLDYPTDEDAEFEDDAVDITPLPSKKSSSKRKVPTLSLVKELDLRPEGKEHFADFIRRKSPKGQMEQICVVIFWLRRILELDGVTPNHVYTCFDSAGFKTPDNLAQAIRGVANKKGWVDSSDGKAIDISMQGINYVNHEMGNGEV